MKWKKKLSRYVVSNVLDYKDLGACLDSIFKQLEEDKFQPDLIVAVAPEGNILAEILGHVFDHAQVLSVELTRKAGKWGVQEIVSDSPDARAEAINVLIVDGVVRRGERINAVRKTVSAHLFASSFRKLAMIEIANKSTFRYSLRGHVNFSGCVSAEPSVELPWHSHSFEGETKAADLKKGDAQVTANGSKERRQFIFCRQGVEKTFVDPEDLRV